MLFRLVIVVLSCFGVEAIERLMNISNTWNDKSLPISYLCTECVLYDTSIGDVFDELEKGPRPNIDESQDVTTISLINVATSRIFTQNTNVTACNNAQNNSTFILSNMFITATTTLLGFINITLLVFLLTKVSHSNVPNIVNEKSYLKIQDSDL